MKIKSATKLPLSIYIILWAVLLSNIIVTFVIVKYSLI